MTDVVAQRDHEVQERLDKEAIREALMRYCRGVDRLDADIISSVYHPDAYDDHAGRIFSGETVGQGLVDWMIEIMDATAHNITTSNIEIYGEQHTLLAMARYVDRFEKRDGEWKILSRVVVPEFTGWLAMQLFEFPTAARRDTTDPSYEVFKP